MTLVAISGGEIIPNEMDNSNSFNYNNNNNKDKDNNNKETKNRNNNIRRYHKERIEFPLILGTFQYNINDPQFSQTFSLNQNIINRLKLYDTKVNKVQLQIHSNWGNENYTCIYRIRIHGDEPQSSQSPLVPL